ncbi:hypothetical protein C2845_PM15G26080 [Panicum miliaceum]|uniref:Uncharacterized protein n=1 Tax=Panicum miliaceum TaxID=4540 RepID=A0A3L6Q4T8_PANMI|nr:hypothetical protein C2845_PM15G26080 [Panicum miliaceum]
MASLRACPSSGIVVSPRRQAAGSWSPLRIIPRFGRRGRSTPLLNLKTSGGRTSTAPGLPYRHAIRAQDGVFGWPSDLDPDDDKPMDAPFREEIETIDEYSKKMISWHTSIFHIRATTLSLHLCMVVRQGVELASTIMDSAVLKHDKQNDISSHTTKKTLAMYVSIFINLAEETYHKRFNVESVFSLLGALRGLAAISHILLQDALGPSPNCGSDSSSNCSLINEIDSARSEFQQRMNTLEDRFRAVSKSAKAYALLRYTLFDAMMFTMFFVSNMVVKREMVPGGGVPPGHQMMGNPTWRGRALLLILRERQLRSVGLI